MKKFVFLVSLLMFWAAIDAFAQASAYSFAQTSGTYSAVSGGATLHASGWDDAVSAATLGFTFTYNGVAYTTCSVNSNGYVTFGSTTSSSTGYSPISATTAYAGAASAFGRDLISNASVVRGVSVGTAPNRTYVIQWENARRYSGGGVAGDVLNFQIRLNETSNTIEIVYGTCTATSTTSLTCQAGLRGATNADYNNRTTTTNWSSTTAGTANSNTCTSTNAIMPANGLTFTYTPPVPCAGNPNGGTANASVASGACSVASTISLTGQSSGVSGLTFQWQSSPDNVTYTNITGATSTTYASTSTATTWYQCVVTCNTAGNTGTANSAPASVTVATTPNAGSATTTVAGGCSSAPTTLGLTGQSSGTLTYQWQSSPDNTTFTNITGATAATYATTVTATTWYRCIVGCSAGGSANSNPVVVTVPGANCTHDAIYTANASYSSIAGTGISMTGWRNGNSTDDNLSTAQPIGFAFTYKGATYTQFSASTNGFLTFNTGTTATGSGTGAYGYSNNFAANTTINSIMPYWEDLVCQGNPGTAAGLASALKYQTTGTAPNRVLTVEWIGMETFGNAGPNLNFQVQLLESNGAIFINYGTMEGFTGSTNFTYSYSMGLAGAALADLYVLQTPNIKAFAATAVDNHSIVMACNSSYLFGPGTPGANDSPPGAPSNDNAGSATNISVNSAPCVALCGTYYTSKNATASPEAVCGGNADDDVWFRFMALAANTTITIRSGGGYDAHVELLDAAFTSVQCSNATGLGLTETLNPTTLVPGQLYYVRIYSTGAGSGTDGQFSICVNSLAPPPANDECAGSVSLSVGANCTPVTGNTVTATASAGVPASSCGTADDDVWYSFVAPTPNPTITVQSGSGFNASFQLFSGECSALTSVACVNNTSTGGTETYAASGLTVGNTYFIRVFHNASGSGTGTFTICVTATAPACASGQSPANGATNQAYTGVTLSWSAAAGATGYDVYLSTVQADVDTEAAGARVSANQTGTTYATGTLNGLTTYYWKAVPKNSVGSATGCSTFSFTTNEPCTGTPAPGATSSTAAAICAGQTFTLSVANPGTQSGLSYQWQSSPDNVTYTDIAGATNTTLATTQTASTWYQLKVTCTPSSSTGTSTPVQVTQNAPLDCYCITGLYTTGCSADDDINSFTFNNILHDSTACTGGFDIADFTDSVYQVTQGLDYTFTVTTEYTSGEYVEMWVDFNDDGLFDNAAGSIEHIFDGTTAFGNATPLSDTVTVPASANVGPHRFRVRLTWNQSAATPCGSYGFGEIHDYTMHVNLPCTPVTFYADTDGDTFGDAASTVSECSAPSGYVADNTDCDDDNADVNPGETETCGNGIDENCDTFDGIGGFDVDVVKVTTACLKFNATISNVINPAPGALLYSKDGGTTWVSTPAFLNLVPSSYTFAVKDAVNCTATQTEVINAPMSLSVTGDALLCFGDTDGEISIDVNDGFPPYSYDWKKGTTQVGTTQTVSNLGFGTYKCTVTDSKGCIKISGNAVISQPAKILVNLLDTDETCFDSNDGSVSNTTTGGTPPYTFAWSSSADAGFSATTQNLMNLAGPSTYTVVVSDLNACSATKSTLVKGALAPLTITSMTMKSVACLGGNNGSATAKISGGNSGLKTFTWSPGGQSGTSGASHTATNLVAGTYSVLVSDVNGCTTSGSVAVTQPTAALALPAPVITATGSTYKVVFSATGGFAPYKYRRSLDYPTNSLWSAPNIGTFTLVPAGTYTFQVNDGGGAFSATAPKGCIVSANYPVPATLKPATSEVRGSVGTDFTLVPNPAAGSVFIDFGGNAPASGDLEIRDSKGSLLRNLNISALTVSGSRISLDGLSTGVFFITIRQEGFAPATKRLVVMSKS